MFDKIQNPETGKWVSIHGTVGKQILKNYVQQKGGRWGRPNVNTNAKEWFQYFLNNPCNWLDNVHGYSNEYDIRDLLTLGDETLFHLAYLACNHSHIKDPKQRFRHLEKCNSCFWKALNAIPKSRPSSRKRGRSRYNCLKR